MLSQALRFGRASAGSTSRLAIARTVTPSLARSYATPTDPARQAQQLTPEEELFFSGPPPPKTDTDAIMKRYVGKGFPRIPGLRHVVYPFHPHLFNGAPLRPLTLAKRRKGGRNHTGQVVNNGIGGGHRQRLRIVDFYRVEPGIHDVVRIEYDPGRSGHIALLHRRGASANAKTKAAADAGALLAETESELPGGSTEARMQRNEVKAGWSYVLAPDGLRAGDTVQSFRQGIPEGFVEGWEAPATADAGAAVDGAEGYEGLIAGSEGSGIHSTATRALGLIRSMTLKPGNVLPLTLIPPGTNIHNLSTNPDGRMQLCRSAGVFAQVVAHHDKDGHALGGADVLQLGGAFAHADGSRLQKAKKAGSVLVRLQSGEVRRLEPTCIATVGIVSNKEHQQRQLGKAGRSRWLGHRPKVRGVAMNTCDHPHGGGRGKSKGGKHPRSQTGLLQGYRTRRPKDKDGNKNVVSQRPRGNRTK